VQPKLNHVDKIEMAKGYLATHDVTIKSQAHIDDIWEYLSTEQFQQIPIKSPAEIAKLKEVGGICAKILDEISPYVVPGVTKKQLNVRVYEKICKKYQAKVDRLASDAQKDAAHHISACFGHNDIIMNAVPDDEPLQTGDIFGIDVSLNINGWCGDTRKTWIVGTESSPMVQRLFAISHQAMWLGISMIKPGAKLTDIANAVETFVNKHGLSMLKLPVTSGHSIGQTHLDGWLIPLYNTPINEGRVLEKGMVITIEPFISAGTGEACILDNDVGSGITKDGAPASYWEHTVAVTENGYEILDLRADEDERWALQAAKFQ